MDTVQRQPSLRDGMYFDDVPSHPSAHAAPKANFSRSLTVSVHKSAPPKYDLRLALKELEDYAGPDRRPSLPFSYERTEILHVVPRGDRSSEKLYFMPEGFDSKQSSQCSTKRPHMPPDPTKLSDSYRRAKDLMLTSRDNLHNPSEKSSCSPSWKTICSPSELDDKADPKADPWPVHIDACAVLYGGDRDKANARLGRTGTYHPRRKIIISMTPSELPVMTGPQPLSIYQMAELKRINRHEKMLPPTPDLIKSDDEVDEPPNGGLLAWLQVLGSFFCVFNAQGLNMSFGIFQAFYELVLLRDCSASKIAWIGSFQIFSLFFSGLIVGPLVDKGHFRICFNGGSLLLLTSLVLTSFCRNWLQLFLVQGVLTGISMGIVFSAVVINTMTYFSTRLGLVSGLAAAGASVGGIVFPLIAKKSIERIGFGWTIRIFALINLVTMLPVNLVVRPRPGWKPSKRSTAFDPTIFRDAPYLLMSAGMFFAYEGVFFGFYFIVAYAQTQLGVSPSGAVNLLISMNASNIFGRFLPNLISDACIGPLNALIPTAFLTACITFLWIGISNVSSLYVLACFYGFSAAGIQSLYSATIYSFVGSDVSKRGIRMGFVFALIGIACLTGSPLGGQLIQLDHGKYLYAQLFSGCVIAVGGCFFLAARWAKSGWSPSRL